MASFSVPSHSRVPPEPLRPSRSDVDRLPIYKGDRDLAILEDWISQMTRCIRFLRVGDEFLPEFVSKRLIGEAQDWFRARFPESSFASFKWKTFSEDLRNAFAPFNATRRRELEYENLHQSGSVQEFVERLRSFQNQLKLTDRQLINKLIARSDPLVGRRLMATDFQTFEAAARAALSLGDPSVVPIDPYYHYPGSSVYSPAPRAPEIYDPMHVDASRIRSAPPPSNEVFCFRCQRLGHLASECNCPRNRPRQRGGRPRLRANQLLFDEYGNEYYVTTKNVKQNTDTDEEVATQQQGVYSEYNSSYHYAKGNKVNKGKYYYYERAAYV